MKKEEKTIVVFLSIKKEDLILPAILYLFISLFVTLFSRRCFVSLPFHGETICCRQLAFLSSMVDTVVLSSTKLEKKKKVKLMSNKSSHPLVF